MSLPAPLGESFGNAGGSLDNFHTWGKGQDQSAADIGKTGEIKTAAILDKLANRAGGPTVLHDLNIPLPRITANIDHALVSGRNVLLIDAKVWKPGIYWTFRGVNRRGFEKIPHTQKQTMKMASDAITGYLRNNGVNATILHPILVVWPSSRKAKLHLRFLKVPGASVVHSDNMSSRKGVLGGLNRTKLKPWASDTANPDVVAALVKLLN